MIPATKASTTIRIANLVGRIALSLPPRPLWLPRWKLPAGAARFELLPQRGALQHIVELLLHRAAAGGDDVPRALHGLLLLADERLGREPAEDIGGGEGLPLRLGGLSLADQREEAGLLRAQHVNAGGQLDPGVLKLSGLAPP